jgi:hypothetical protein
MWLQKVSEGDLKQPNVIAGELTSMYVVAFSDDETCARATVQPRCQSYGADAPQAGTKLPCRWLEERMKSH